MGWCFSCAKSQKVDTKIALAECWSGSMSQQLKIIHKKVIIKIFSKTWYGCAIVYILSVSEAPTISPGWYLKLSEFAGTPFVDLFS